MQAIVEVSGFSKQFGGTPVVANLSFEVGRGEIFAFLGANGSGKTTTVRTLLGIYQPDAGDLLINGRPYVPEMSPMLGYLPEERGLYATSRVLETLVYFGELKGLDRSEAKARARRYLERVGLADKANTPLKKLSGGQQQKVQLGATMINTPELLVLDEPTKALDPVNRALLMELLLELNQAGSTIIFITHQMDEVERVAERLVMIKDGQRALYGHLSEIKKQFRDNTLHVGFEGVFPEHDELYSAVVRAQSATVTPHAGVDAQQILKVLLDGGLTVTEFALHTPSLDDIFLQVSQEQEGAR